MAKNIICFRSNTYAKKNYIPLFHIRVTLTLRLIKSVLFTISSIILAHEKIRVLKYILQENHYMCGIKS